MGYTVSQEDRPLRQAQEKKSTPEIKRGEPHKD